MDISKINYKVLTGIGIIRGVRIADGMMLETDDVFRRSKCLQIITGRDIIAFKQEPGWSDLKYKQNLLVYL